MKILLSGASPLADGIAEFLLQLEWAQLAGLVIDPEAAERAPTAERARSAGIPLMAPDDTPPADHDIFVAAEPPAAHHAAWSEASRLGGLLVHLSLLPRHRGADPIRWALLEGDSHCGATVIYIGGEDYGGNILAQEREEIKDTYDAAQLDDILRGTARDMLVKVLHALAKIGPLPGTPQKLDDASSHDVPPEQSLCELDFSAPLTEVHRRVMAFCHPHCGARTRMNEDAFMLWRVRPVPKKSESEEAVLAKHFKGDKAPGALLAGPEDRWAVRCGCGGVLELIEVQLGEPYDPKPPAELFADGGKLG